MDRYIWQEDPKLKNLYEAEIGALQRGLNGDFKLRKFLDLKETEGRIAALGTLKYGKSKQQDLVIVFPTKYPRGSPRIIPVDLTEVSGMQKSYQARHFGKGNQYADGGMCLLRTDHWNSNEYGIGAFLRRAQKWLISATSVKGFDLKDVVDERPQPYQHSGQVLLPRELVVPVDLHHGQIILTQFKTNHFVFEDNVLPNPMNDLNLGKTVFRWYKFDNTVIADLLPSLKASTIFEIVKTQFGEELPIEISVLHLAFYCPSDDNPWHFFRLIPTRLGNNINVQTLYFVSRTISRELYHRTSDIFDPEILLKKRVTVVGLGALGSEVVKSLAKNGVGHFNLFDHDTFEIGNSIRHAADLYYIGENKANVAKKLILKSNPNITANTYPINILDDNGTLETALEGSDLCLVLTAEDSVDYLINDIYYPKFRIPFLFARVSPGGLSGAIQIVNEDTACLQCLSTMGKDTLPKPKGSIQFEELEPEYGRCSTPAVPGSEVDTKEVALQVARVSLQLLAHSNNVQYPRLKGSQYYWHGPFGTNEKPPFTWEIRNSKKHPLCPICPSSG